jgi:radical SAM protein with 4Fe4S-binding SPASM domain
MNNKFLQPIPKVIRIEPSGLCNLSCLHCPTGTIKQKRGVMKPGTFKIVMEFITSHVSNLRIGVLYHGGEPLLSSDFIYMVKAVKEGGIPFVKTVSNGMLLSKPLAKELVLSGLDSIEVSLDGLSPEMNNWIRRKSDFNVVVKNINHLIDNKIEFASKTPEIFITTTQFLNQNVDFSIENIATPMIPEYLLREFDEHLENGHVMFKSNYALVWPYMYVEKEIFNIYEENSCKLNFCDHINNTLTILWNGNVVPCCYDLTGKYIMGNIHSEEIETIWNNEKSIAIRKSIHEMKYNDLCKNCAVIGNKRYLVLRNAKVI